MNLVLRLRRPIGGIGRSSATFYKWKPKYGGFGISQVAAAWHSRASSATLRGTASPSGPLALSVPMEQMSMESSLQVILRQAASREQRPFIILGFLTGLALSAVIGAVLYVYLTLG